MKSMQAFGPVVIAFLAAFGVIGSGHGVGRFAAQSPPDQPRRPDATEFDLSIFGIGSCHTNNRSVDDNLRWVPLMSAIDLRVYRTPQTEWSALEPQEGQWTWKALDEQVVYLADRNFTFGAILAGCPAWNKKDKPGSLPVNNLPAWSNYVTQVARRLKGKVKYFEVWNEPPNFTGPDQTPADYAKIVISAYDACKAVDPNCFVALAAKSAHVNYLEQVIKAGAKDHFDLIVLHPYEVLNGIADNIGTEPVYLHISATVRKMLAAQNPAKVDVPIIFTELGCDAKMGADRQAHALIKAYTMGIAQGVRSIQWFEGRDGDSGPMGLIDDKGIPRPAFTALAQMIRHFGQKPKYKGWLQLNGKDYGFVFEGARGTVLAAWAPAGKPDRVDFGQDVLIVDPLLGKESTVRSYDLGVAPVFVVGVPEKLVAEASANRGIRFPWGGDYSQAQSVSIAFGERTIERGLHTASGADVARAVVAYGGPARAGGVPGGNVFIVDPNFLSYTPTPIEISAVVRRNEANDNAGFKLVYESTNGFKTAGSWYTIPDNKEWHTVKWRIDDSQFVNYWGFNFALESDVNQYNKYYIKSITMTKVS